MSIADKISRIISSIHGVGCQPARIYLDEDQVAELERNRDPLLATRPALRGTERKFMSIVITTGPVANPPRVIDTNGKAYLLDQ
jgi:hypothetical protein